MPPQKPSAKKIIAPIVAILVLAGLIMLGLRAAKEPTAVQPGNEPIEVISWPSEQVRTETVTDTSGGYDITATYPVTKSDAITTMFRTFITDQIDAFKKDTAPQEDVEVAITRPMTLEISYEAQQSDRAQTYVFSIYSDTGGAHGLQTTRTFAFTETGNQIILSDLFTNGTKGLSTVSDYVQKELVKEELTNKEWVTEGAAPTEDNYRNFVVTDAGVTFIFDPYQVAAYAAGIKRVAVPVSEFRSIANPALF